MLKKNVRYEIGFESIYFFVVSLSFEKYIILNLFLSFYKSKTEAVLIVSKF